MPDRIASWNGLTQMPMMATTDAAPMMPRYRRNSAFSGYSAGRARPRKWSANDDPASSMNTTTTHCAYAPNAPSEAGSVPKPPVDMVVRAWAPASKSVISPAHSNRVSRAVNPAYRYQRRRAVPRNRGVRRSGEMPGASARASSTPPSPRSGRIATDRMMIPIPPSHCVKARQMTMPWLRVPGSCVIEEPVVVNPAAVSKKALVKELISPVSR